MDKTRTAIGIDFGGTFIKAGVVSGEGKLLSRDRISTEATAGRDAVIDRIAQVAESVREKAGLTWDEIDALGIGTPGPVNPERGILTIAVNVPGWINVPLKDIFEARFNVKTTIVNDANAATYGEYWVGAGHGCGSMILLTLGTGIGGGYVLDGNLWAGIDGTAAEIGHTTICYNGPECSCGSFGCIEAYASATAIVRRAKEAIAEGKASSLAKIDTERLTAKDIHEAAVAGDELAITIIEDTGKYLGILCGNLVNIFNPEIILFSGGVADAGEMLFGPVREVMKKRSYEAGAARVKILLAALPGDAGIIGAAGCALKALETSAS